MKGLVELAGSGCYLEYDQFGIEVSYYTLDPAVEIPSDAQRIGYIAGLISEGLVEQVLIAHDVYAKHRLTRYGGHGYAHILEYIVPRMKLRGITEAQIHTMMVENPKRVLTFA